MNLNLTDATASALQELWAGFFNFIPALILAIIFFIIGWFVAVLIGKLVDEILKRLKFNQIFEKGDWKAALNKAEIKVDASGFIGAIVKWVLVIVVLQVSVGILRWDAFAELLEGVIGYLPNVIVAALIFVVAVILADILQKVVVAAAEGAKFTYTKLAGKIVKWAIWIFAILAILQQLKFEAADWIFELIKIVFIGIVAMIAIAFGLGGKDTASEILKDLKAKMKE